MELTEFEKTLSIGEFVGIVENSTDPDKKQRIKVRVPYLHGLKTDIPTEALPWSHPNRLNNTSFQVPSINTVVNVRFPSGSMYFPVYDSYQHLDINLQKKIESYDGDNYTKFISILYNVNTQIFIDNQKGLYLQHKDQLINISESGIALDLEDNSSKLVLGDENSDQEAMLGTHWMAWFDNFMQTILNPYLGNLGAPVVANPDLIARFNEYQALRKTFLSKHVYVVDNDCISSNKIKTVDQTGDNIVFNNKSVELKVTNVPLDPIKEQYAVTSTKATNAQKREEIGDHVNEELQNNDKSGSVETVGAVNSGHVQPITSVNKAVSKDDISVYVTYAEATYSRSAVGAGLDNMPTPEHLDSMKNVASKIFDPCYEYMLAKYGIKLKVNSFYRNPDVDYKVQLIAVDKGQAKTAKYANSQHTKGQAVDMNAGRYNKELFYYIKNNFNFDQMLWEFGTDDTPNWVHVSLRKDSGRNQVAQMKTGGKFILYRDSSISPEVVV